MVMRADHSFDGDSEITSNKGKQALPMWMSFFSFTTKAHVILLGICIFLSLISGLIIPVQAYLIGGVFDILTNFATERIAGDALVDQVSQKAFQLTILGCIIWLLSTCLYIAWITFGELQAKSARDSLYSAMLYKDMIWYDTRKAGINTVIPRFQVQIRELQLAVSQPIGLCIQHLATLLGSVALAMYTSWDLSLITLAAMPLGAGLVIWLSNSTQSLIEKQTESVDIASRISNAAIGHIEAVKAFNGQAFEIGRYIEAMTGGARCYIKVAMRNALEIGISRLFILSMFIQGFWYGTHLVREGKKDAGDILTAFWACILATGSIEEILPQMMVLEKGRYAGAALSATLADIRKSGEHIIGSTAGRRPDSCEGDVMLSNVSFSYPSRPSHLALDDVSLFFPAGETTFIVGKSGSGKSTLSNLILRFYDPAQGTVSIDKINIGDLDIGWLRNNVTLVQQESLLFNESLLKNIAFGHNDYEGIDKDDVKASIELADLAEIILALPHGLDTMAGQGGNALSGGQRQRIAIARARVRDTSILIMDEATSGLDHQAKAKIMESIYRWRRSKTTIIITHDVSQIQPDQFVYVLEQGRVVEDGYRRKLESKSGSHFAILLSAAAATGLGSVSKNHSEHRPSPQTLGKKDGQANRVEIFPVSGHGASENVARDTNLGLCPPYRDQEHDRRRSQTLSLISVARPGSMASSHYIARSLRAINQPSVCRTNKLDFLSTNATPFAYLEGQGNRLETSFTSDMLHKGSAPQNVFKRSMAVALKSSSVQELGLENLDTVDIGQERQRKLEQQRPLLSLKEILKTVWPNLRPKERVSLLLGFGCTLLHAVGMPVFSWVFSQLLTTFYMPPEAASTQALKWSLAVLAVAFLDSFTSLLMHYLLEKAGQGWVDGLRVESMKRILDQPKEWFDQRKEAVSEIVSCLDRSAEEMRNLIGRFAGYAFMAVVVVVTALVWCLVESWKLTLVGVAATPMLYAVTRGFENVSGVWEGKCNAAGEAAANVFADTFGNLRIVRAFTLEAYFHRKHAMASLTAVKVGLKRAVLSGLFFGITDASVVFFTALVFWYGSLLSASGEFDVNKITTVITMLTFSISSANNIIAFIPQINSSRDTATQLLRLTQLPLQSSHEHRGDLTVSHIPGPISFRNVTFSYPSRSRQEALSAVSLSIPLHRSTALVGASGSGKSTIISLILGFYATDQDLAPAAHNRHYHHRSRGSIYVGAHPLLSLDLRCFRSLIAYVPQQSVLFPGTVAENITYGLDPRSRHASPVSVSRAAAAAGIDAFVESLPQGYQTRVGEGGTGLSGGQVQRLAVARALVREPELLIMDEPTSGLDQEAARLIRELVARLVSGGSSTTVLVVSHSVQMMRACGRCVVLERGRVAEEGMFDDLMADGDGVLRRLLDGGEDLT